MPAKLSDAFRRITGRKPASNEIKLLTEFYDEEKKKFAKNVPAASKILQIGQYEYKGKLNEPEAAALMLTIQMIYNLDESISKT
jgi:hypothetical protein